MRGSVNQMVHSAVFAALIAVCAQIQIPLPIAPVNLALLPVHLAAVLLRPRATLASTAAYALLGLMGLPVFTGMRGGPGVLFGPTGGFILGYCLCSLVTSRLVRGGRSYPRLCLAMTCGTLCCYAQGTLWFMLLTGTGLLPALGWCVLPFVPGDAAKILLGAALAGRMRRLG